MTHQEIMELLQDIMREQFDDENLQVTEATTSNDIEDWDSLANLELISSIEEKFHIRFSLGEINSFANVGEMCDGVLKHLG